MDALVSLFSRSPTYQSSGRFLSSDSDRTDRARGKASFLEDSWLFFNDSLEALHFPVP